MFGGDGDLVSMVVADDLVPYGHQDISSHHAHQTKRNIDTHMINL